jgi:hypothetical protein
MASHNSTYSRKLCFLAACLATLTFQISLRADQFRELLGDKFANSVDPATQRIAPDLTGDAIHRWNEIAINATGLDHTPVPPGDPRVFGEQLGPGRAARAMAIIHIAMFDTMNAVDHRYESYTGVQSFQHPISLLAAVAQSAHDTLVALYPSQAAAFHARLAEDLAQVHNNQRDGFHRQAIPRGRLGELAPDAQRPRRLAVGLLLRGQRHAQPGSRRFPHGSSARDGKPRLAG